ncbi:hypothetical protein BVG19_g4377 [[Candida] boidinii]|nr:hypothetical protein BVG19_g4377 [[Candida] boidinii]OWB51936.1 hypothetical protein B5S27_g3507 [[Candida] boidinii]
MKSPELQPTKSQSSTSSSHKNSSSTSNASSSSSTLNKIKGSFMNNNIHNLSLSASNVFNKSKQPQSSTPSTNSTTPVLEEPKEQCICPECLDWVPPTPFTPSQATSPALAPVDYFTIEDKMKDMVLEDVLPSFDVDRFMLSRKMDDINSKHELPSYHQSVSKHPIQGTSSSNSASNNIGSTTNSAAASGSHSSHSVHHRDQLSNSAQEQHHQHHQQHHQQQQEHSHSIQRTENRESEQALPSFEEALSTGQQHEVAAPEDESVFINPDKLVLNNLDKLPKINVPLKISIIITKELPQMGKPLVRENGLKEFKPGDIVTGYIIVENPAPFAIPFDMFLVSLEGNITIPVSSSSPSSSSHPKLVRKKFLQMFDLAASYHPGYLPTTLFETPYDVTYDATDDTIYGFNEDQEIQPGKKYKKFFMFKLPSQLLDNACDHELVEHISPLPPSLGVDCDSFERRANNIQVSEFLGYGRLDDVGSPLLTHDQSTKGQSISYSITTRFIGSNKLVYEKYLQKDSSITDKDIKHIMIKSSQYFIRFCPVESSLNILESMNLMYTENSKPSIEFKRPDTNVQLTKIEKLANKRMNEMKHKKQLLDIGITDQGELDELTNDLLDMNDYTIQTSTIDHKKSVQLKMKTTTDQIMTRNNTYEYTESKLMPLTKKITGLSFSGKSSDTTGSILVSGSVSKITPLEYVTPKTLKKIASGNANNKAIINLTGGPGASTMNHNNNGGTGGLESLLISPTLSPTVSSEHIPSIATISNNNSNSNTNIIGFSAVKSSSSLSSVMMRQNTSGSNFINSSVLDEVPLSVNLKDYSIELTYRPESNQSKPPEISTIRTGLNSITVSSPQAVPITFDPNFFNSNKAKASHTLLMIKKKYSAILENLKTTAKESNCGIPKQLYYDLISLSNLQIKEVTIPLFKEFNVSKYDLNNSGASGSGGGSNSSNNNNSGLFTSISNGGNGLLLKPSTSNSKSGSNAGLSYSKSNDSGYHSSVKSHNRWEPIQEQIKVNGIIKQRLSWKRTIKVPLNLDPLVANKSCVLPTFTSCLVSRCYFLEVSISFKKYSLDGQKLFIPVEVQKCI